MLYLIDSYAWIEYFIGSSKGEMLRRLLLDNKNSFLTLECCLAEIKGWSLRNGQDFDELFKIIKANSNITRVEEDDWIAAAELRFEERKTKKHFGLIDAVILAKQKVLNCKIISGDEHFKNKKNVVFMGVGQK